MHPWVQEFYPALGLGFGERLLLTVSGSTPTPWSGPFRDHGLNPPPSRENPRNKGFSGSGAPILAFPDSSSVLDKFQSAILAFANCKMQSQPISVRSALAQQSLLLLLLLLLGATLGTFRINVGSRIGIGSESDPLEWETDLFFLSLPVLTRRGAAAVRISTGNNLPRNIAESSSPSPKLLPALVLNLVTFLPFSTVVVIFEVPIKSL